MCRVTARFCAVASGDLTGGECSFAASLLRRSAFRGLVLQRPNPASNSPETSSHNLRAQFRSAPPEAGGELLQAACPGISGMTELLAGAGDRAGSRLADHLRPPALQRLRF